MASVAPALENWLEREIAQWVRRPIASGAPALTTELHLAPDLWTDENKNK